MWPIAWFLARASSPTLWLSLNLGEQSTSELGIGGASIVRIHAIRRCEDQSLGKLRKGIVAKAAKPLQIKQFQAPWCFASIIKSAGEPTLWQTPPLVSVLACLSLGGKNA